MFAPGNLLQTETNWTLWGLVILAVLLLIILWWFFFRRGEQAATAPAVPVRAPEKTSPDDLTKIEGIGPRVANVLKGAGITTFEALARANPADVQKTLNAAGLQMMNPEGWIEQARLAAQGDWAGFEKLQGELKGGRRK
jgi:hypothetical protein